VGLAGCDLGEGIGIHAGSSPSVSSAGPIATSPRSEPSSTPPPWPVRADADQILVTRQVNQCAHPEFSANEAKVYQLNGFPEPIELYAA
jgi:hypothetical protein